MSTLERLYNRLDALEICFEKIKDLRLYLCKAESQSGHFRYVRYTEENDYNEHLKCYETLRNYLFMTEIEKLYRN